MSAQIRALKESLVEQNEMIKTLRSDRQIVRDTIQSLYTALVRYKVEYDTNSTAIESGTYPTLSGEDMTKYQVHELLKKVGEAFSVVTESLNENRAEVRSMYKELDQDVSAALSEWESIRLQDRADQKAVTFRNNLAATASRPRTSTPEPVVPTSTGAHGTASLPSPPDSAGKKEKSERPLEPIKTDKSKTATKTLGDLISPVKGTAKTDSKKR